jgi:GH24 family phage-related lysozyme (muramidase)
MNRKTVFDVVRAMLGRSFTQAEVDKLDDALDSMSGNLTAGLPPSATPAAPPAANTERKLGEPGKKLMKHWEGCAKLRADGRYDAYPDPGSVDGKPWTIGWGSTGPDIKKGVIWTQEQCDARFEKDIVRYVNEVAAFIGKTPTTQNQFDALVSFHYNTGKIAASTLGRLHREGNYAGAAAEFGRWIYNDGKPMAGLKNRREDEAALYRKA